MNGHKCAPLKLLFMERQRTNFGLQVTGTHSFIVGDYGKGTGTQSKSHRLLKVVFPSYL